MPSPGITLSALRARLDERDVLERRLSLRIDRALLTLSEDAVGKLLPSNSPVRLESLGRGRILLRTSFTAIGGVAEISVEPTPSGRARIRFLSFKAAGLLRIPLSMVMLAVRNFLPARPGLHFGQDDTLEVDFAELARPAGIELAPLTGALVDQGVIELRFGG